VALFFARLCTQPVYIIIAAAAAADAA